MSNFDLAVEYVLDREQGFVDSPTDSGGATNFGISLRFLRELSTESLRKYGIFEPITAETIRNLTRDQAKVIYEKEFWDSARFFDIRGQLLCNYIFDMAVNLGLSQAIKIVQRSLWALSFSRVQLADDGLLGDHTLDRLNLLTQTTILPVIVASRAAFYRLLVEIKPKDKEYLEGWLTRCYKV